MLRTNTSTNNVHSIQPIPLMMFHILFFSFAIKQKYRKKEKIKTHILSHRLGKSALPTANITTTTTILCVPLLLRLQFPFPKQKFLSIDHLCVDQFELLRNKPPHCGYRNDKRDHHDSFSVKVNVENLPIQGVKLSFLNGISRPCFRGGADVSPLRRNK